MSDRLGDKIRLQHILDAIGQIEIYTDGVDFEHFASNKMMFDATLRQLEIIGEACNRLSNELIQNNKDVYWARIIGLRNLVIHEYFGIDDLTIWNIIKLNLPAFKAQIYLIIKDLG